MNSEHVVHLQRMANESWRGSSELSALVAAIVALSTQQSATCAGCEGNPSSENTPCAVCGQQPAADGGFTAADMMDARQEGRREAQQLAADPLAEWANSPLNFTATVGVFEDGVQPAAVDEAMVERIATLLHEEATDEPWTVAGVEHDGPDRDYYRTLARKVIIHAGKQPAACPKCEGTGEADSGGIHPWGAPATIPCDCQQPTAVDEAMVERAWEAAMEIKHNKEPWFPMTKRRMKRALGAALTGQPGGES